MYKWPIGHTNHLSKIQVIVTTLLISFIKPSNEKGLDLLSSILKTDYKQY